MASVPLTLWTAATVMNFAAARLRRNCLRERSGCTFKCRRSESGRDLGLWAWCGDGEVKSILCGRTSTNGCRWDSYFWSCLVGDWAKRKWTKKGRKDSRKHKEIKNKNSIKMKRKNKLLQNDFIDRYMNLEKMWERKKERMK